MESSATPPIAALRNEELLKDAQSFTYFSNDDTELNLYAFLPDGHNENDARCAVLFFHGGQWDQEMLSQFAPQALNFVSHGAVGIVAEYRTADPHETTPMESIQDAQHAIFWLRKNHSELGIDPHKVVVAGAGSGAHIALCAAMHKKVVSDAEFTSTPDALILWSAIIDTTKRGIGNQLFTNAKDARRTSPTKNIRRKLPPMLFFHGNEDPVTPVAAVDKFCQRMRSKRNIARFVPFNRATHSFFNFNVNQHYFVQTLENAEGFLMEQGFLAID